MSINKGKFIVIDGTDGSGKATQTKILVDRLVRAGLEVKMADFPQYNTKSAGLVEEYLSGKYGSAEAVGPYRASIFYAADRYDASFRIKRWLSEGKIVIANRYVTANLGHQGGKISDSLERKHFFSWLNQLEYEIFAIPRPDLNIILHVSAAISQALANGRKNLDWRGKTGDIHQENLPHLKMAEKVYLEIAANFPDMVLVECVSNGQIKSRETISDLIWREIVKLFKPEAYSPNFKRLHENSPAPAAAETPVKQADQLIVQKISPWAKLPTRAYEHDAGLDLYSADYYSLYPGDRTVIKTGLKLVIPAGCAGLIWDKGGVAKNGIHTIAGVIDAGYRGEITVNLVNLSQDIYHIAPGQKIAQLLIQKVEAPEIVAGEIDPDTDRKTNRFGSSGLF